MDEFSQSVPVPICKRSIQRRLSNLWLSQENCCEKTVDFVENRFLFFLIHPDVGEIPAVFSHGSSLVFLDMLETPFM
jgi:hypothetical protein